MPDQFQKLPATQPFEPWLVVLIAFVVFLGSEIAAVLLLELINARPSVPTGSSLMAEAGTNPDVGRYFVDLTLVRGTIGIAVLYGLIRQRVDHQVWNFMALIPVPPLTFLRWVGYTILVVVAAELLEPLLRDSLGGNGPDDPLGNAELSLVMVLAVVVVAPIFEEIVFRGFLFDGLRGTSLGTLGSALLLTSIWTLLHAQPDPATMVFVFALGLVFSFARIITGSLIVPIGLHGLFNAVQLWVGYA